MSPQVGGQIYVVDPGPITEHKSIFCRYLRAVKWKTTKAAIQRLEATLKWRREYGIYDVVSANHVEPEVRNNFF